MSQQPSRLYAAAAASDAAHTSTQNLTTTPHGIPGLAFLTLSAIHMRVRVWDMHAPTNNLMILLAFAMALQTACACP